VKRRSFMALLGSAVARAPVVLAALVATIALAGCDGGSSGGGGAVGGALPPAGSAPVQPPLTGAPGGGGPLSATLNWTQPSTDQSNAPLAVLTGNNVYVSQVPGDFTAATVVTVTSLNLTPGANVTFVLTSGLATGANFIAVTALNVNGESGFSNVIQINL